MFWKSVLIFLFTGLFIRSLSAQNNFYTQSWKKVDSLLNKKGLTQSALETVTSIYNRAQKEKNNAQLIKALIYRIGLRASTEMNATDSAIAVIESEIKRIPEPASSILRSIEAEMLWIYYGQNRWKLNDRTPTLHFNKKDISSWDAEDFFKKISELYLSSLTNFKLLQQTRLDAYDPILIKGNSRDLRPTLFDLLGHRALDFFKNDEIDLTRPSYYFELADETVFADKNIFVSHRFSTIDSLSNHFKALKLFQQLIQFHINDPKPDALLDIDIERVEFAFQYATMENKEAHFIKALQNIGNQYGTLPAAAQAWYLLARNWSDKASSYNPFSDTANRLGFVRAKEICDQILHSAGKNPADSSEGLINADNLLQDIQRERLHLETEKVNLPGQPFRVLVTYRNLARFHFRIIKVSPGQLDSLVSITYNENYWKKLIQLNSSKTNIQDLPDTKDFQEHKVEIKISALEPGSYIMLASGGADFKMEGNPMAAQIFYVSNLSFVQNDQDFFVLNRETGQPIQGVTVQVWYKYYDANLRKQASRRGEQFNTDKNGYFHLSPSKTKSNNTYRLELSSENDHLLMNDQFDYYRYDRTEYSNATKEDQKSYEADNLKGFFFLDRSIYRPGQTIYFKGIVVTRDFSTKQFKILSSFKTRVFLFDADGQPLDSMDITTNDFGSYHGKFILPVNRLTGEFNIKDDSTKAEQGFSVEEYKRPKFNVAFDSLVTEYRINDKIKITGRANSYAGNPIDGAIVKYRIVRNSSIPYPLFTRRPRPESNTEITHGEIKTNRDGTFDLEFIAAPDLSVTTENSLIFNYRVIADVTDINGETRTGETTVNVGYQSMTLDIELPEENMPADQFRNVSIRTQNLNNKFQSTDVRLSIYRLSAPERLIRNRYWSRPDQFVMSKDEYLANFPHDEYDDEKNVTTWSRKEKIVEFSDSTKPGKLFQWQGTLFLKGWYAIVATTHDKYGEQVSNTKFIQLFDPATGEPGVPEYVWFDAGTQKLEPGFYAIPRIGSSAKDLFVIKTIDSGKSKNDPSYQYLKISNERKTDQIFVSEAMRGGFGIYYCFVKNNRVFTSTNQIIVPWTNKELKIEYETFRDKSLPGSEEKWKIKVSGAKANPVAAEALASMYDAALDQIKPHQWLYPDIFPTYTINSIWRGDINFSITASFDRYRENYLRKYFAKKYDKLLQFQSRQYERKIMYSYANVGPTPAPMASEDSAEVVAHKVDLTYRFKTGTTANYVEKKIATPTIVRKNFNETAFFYPNLLTDSSGAISFSFTLPEALTQWRSMIFAHTKDLVMGYAEKTIVTQKSLMVQPNAPRFLREGDHVELSTKIVNMTDSEMTGQIHLQMIDPETNQPVDSHFANRLANQYFTIAPRQSAQINFPLEVPFQYNQPISYRIVAQSTSYSDGEEATLPVLPNRTLVTESLPLAMQGTGKKNFRFDQLLESGKSESQTNYGLTVEYSTNPAWYAVQALPFLMEFPYECAEQTFNRFYANAIGTRIVSGSPRMRQTFETWRNKETTTLQSNLQKNEELKSVLLQETPWMIDAQDESKQKRNIGILFSEERMKNELQSAISKLQNLQLSNGGFPWFAEGQDDRFITQYILTGIGRLKKMDAIPATLQVKINEMTRLAIAYLDARIVEDFDATQLKKVHTSSMPKIGAIQINYLYMRSFFPNIPIASTSQTAVKYFVSQEKKYWINQGKFTQGMIALTLFRNGDHQTAREILASLKQNAIVNSTEGMYWKTVTPGIYWYQALVETESLLIEAFQEINQDAKSVDQMKTWLLNQKQTQNWKTTKATADACYALLMQGSDWLNQEQNVQISAGDLQLINSANNAEAGTGYSKKRFDASQVQSSMGNLTVSVSGKGASPSWGAVYWQYFEDFDKISAPAKSKSLLSIAKKVFLEKNSDRGPVLVPIEDKGNLKIGDKIKIRIEIRSDRDLEYVHLKDMRASCSEPLNVLSGYKWQGDLGYYESTRDASTNFFIGWLPRGTHVFEYSLFISEAGNFSNGITTIQCMYAPEFSAHSEGIRINVE